MAKYQAQFMSNIFSIDVEDYFMVSALEGVVKRHLWDSYEHRIEHNLYRLLELIEDYPKKILSNTSNKMTATFFFLGWVAEKYPHLVQDVQKAGHEIASHGYDHTMITKISPKLFREDVRKTKIILEDLSGQRVIGYRAPSYSITKKSLWALKILTEVGYQYDSSIFPIYHDLYGIPDAPTKPFLILIKHSSSFRFIPLDQNQNILIRNPFENGFLIEFPPTTIRLFGRNVPIAGGGYFRLFPLKVFSSAFKKANMRNQFPSIFYIHPWEIDPQQPRFKGLSLKSKFRHYVGLNQTVGKMKKLLRDVPFSSFRNFLSSSPLEGLNLELRRRWKRFKIGINVKISVTVFGSKSNRDLLGEAHVIDICCGGALLSKITLNELISNDDLINSHFKLLGIFPLNLSPTGKVVRLADLSTFTVGIEFRDLNHDQIEYLSNYIQEHFYQSNPETEEEHATAPA